jgi:hypothetical protein
LLNHRSHMGDATCRITHENLPSRWKRKYP